MFVNSNNFVNFLLFSLNAYFLNTVLISLSVFPYSLRCVYCYFDSETLTPVSCEESV